MNRAAASLGIGMLALAACSSADALHGDGPDSRDDQRDAARDARRDVQADLAPPMVVLPPEKVAVLAGTRSGASPQAEAFGLYGTDLGVSFAHHDEMRIIFGDTWSDASGALIDPARDDCHGVISIADEPGGFPDGDSVDEYVAAQPLAANEPWWSRSGPPIAFHTVDERLTSFELYRGGFHDQQPVDMGVGKAVVAGFSNERDGAFAIFRRDVPVQCSGGAEPSCGDGFTCDRDLGLCSNAVEGEYALPCVAGGDGCGGDGMCLPVEGGGFCQDRTSSMFGAGDDDGRLQAVVIQHEVGNSDPQRPARYYTQAWLTNKFTNPIAKTVADFDPERADPDDNDYRPADGSRPEREKVLLWGRPHSVGTGALGRDARLYFAYVDMPEYSATGEFAWQPHYFTGFDDGKPMFSDLQSDAVALDVGGAPSPETEPFDVVDRTAVSYLESMDVWVMFYGGDFAPLILGAFVGPSFGSVVRDPQGAIHARFAKHPWGPWTEPAPALQAGDPNVSPPAPDSEYASAGMLAHPGCTGTCVQAEQTPLYALTPYGFLYAPNIFDPWTEVREDGDAVDIYWNVSTWNPYQVVLLKTRIRR